jgi:hypothetical protein
MSATGKWLTLREFGARLEDATAGQVKSAIQGLSLGPHHYRGDGDAREYSPDAQTAIIQALRRKSIDSTPTRRDRRST